MKTLHYTIVVPNDKVPNVDEAVFRGVWALDAQVIVREETLSDIIEQEDYKRLKDLRHMLES